MDTRALDKLGAPEMLEALKTMTASSITAVVLAAKILDSRRNEPAVAEWFAERSTRAALLAWERVGEEDRNALQTGPTALCNDHVPAGDAPWRCGKCGKPLGPIPASDRATASVIAEFAVREGFACAAVVGLRLESALEVDAPGLGGVVVRVDGGIDLAPDCPPIINELATQLRGMADELDKRAAALGQGIARRVVMSSKPTGDN